VAPARSPGTDGPALRLGIDLGGTKIHAVVLDPTGQVRWEQRTPTPRDDYDATLRALAGVVEAATAATCTLGSSPLTVGIGGPGSFTREGLLKNANSTWLNARPIERDLATRLGRPVRYANDANCLALSEATDGSGAGFDVVFAVILGTGTGAGIAVHGQVLTGPNGLAGEWGHNPLPWLDAATDPVFDCYCGQRGCAETLLSGSGLARAHAWRHGGSLRGEEIVALAEAGDAACRATLDHHVRYLARGLAGVINLLDPDVIVLGGGLSRLAHLYEQVPPQWACWVFSGGQRDVVRTRLVPARHGDASGVRGAAWIGV
jgi:fructokinase